MEFLPPGCTIEPLAPSVSDKLISLLDGCIHATAPVAEFTVPIKDGWSVVVFYDDGEFDYLDSFIAPDGNVVDFWDWPDSRDRQALVDWSPNPETDGGTP